MRKTFRLEHLCCAHCAAELEHALEKIPGVDSVSVVFITQKLIIEADEADFSRIIDTAETLIRKKEPECKLVR